MQRDQPVEAKAGLNACLHREPGFAWRSTMLQGRAPAT